MLPLVKTGLESEDAACPVSPTDNSHLKVNLSQLSQYY